MVNSLLMAGKVIFPVVFLLVLGILCRKGGLIRESTTQDMNRLVFYLFLPCLSFVNVYTAEKETFLTRDNMVLLTICIVITVASALLAEVFLKIHRYSASSCGVLTQGVYQTNGMIFALPIITTLCGTQQLAPLSLLILVLSPLYTILSVWVLSPVQRMQKNWKRTWIEIIKTPMLIATLVGAVLMAAEVEVPQLVMDVLEKVANLTTPISFLILGASLRLTGFTKDWKELVGVGVVRLMVIPGVCFLVGLLLGLRGVHMVTLVGLMGAPIAVSSFSLAQRYGADTSLAAELVTVSTIAAGGTMLIWIALLNYFGV